MKLLTLIISMLLSTAVFSASVDIEVNQDPLFQTWETLEVDPLAAQSLRYKAVQYSGSFPRISWESENNSLVSLYKNDSKLMALWIGGLGNYGFNTYPEIQNEFSDYILKDDEPYILDETGNTIWRWNNELDYWVDLSGEVTLPSGKITHLIQLNGNSVVSIEGGENTGLWHVGEEVYQISPYKLEKGFIAHTNTAYVQIIVDESDLNFKIYSMGQDKPLLDTGLNSIDYKLLSSASSASGTVVLFEDADANIVYFWVGEEDRKVIEVPNKSLGLKGCYTSYPQIFCAFTTVDEQVVLYELNKGEFRADTILGPISLYLNASLYNVKAIGDRRYFALWRDNGNTVRNQLAVATPIGVWSVLDNTVDSEFFRFNMFRSRELGIINWLNITSESISLTKVRHVGETGYVENAFEGSDIDIVLDGREAEEEDRVFPVAEVGSFSFMLLFSMLMLLSVRRSKARL
jgi:hypothetical protein